MKTCTLTTAFLLFCILLGNSTHAQSISRNPVKKAASANKTLFTLPDDNNHFFRIDLPDENFLTIRFEQLSQWEPNSIPTIFATAQQAYMMMKDSFRSATSARKIAVHLSEEGGQKLYLIEEKNTEKKTYAEDGRSVVSVRIAVDSITIFKATKPSKDLTSDENGILYTFLLKDLAAIETIANNTEAINKISEMLDKVVADKQAKWRKPDAFYHGISAQLEVSEDATSSKMSVENDITFWDRFSIYVEYGVGFMAGEVPITSNSSILYSFNSAKDLETGFIGLSLSGLSFIKVSNNELRRSYISFMNVEIGGLFAKGSSLFPVYKASVGFGYKVDEYKIGALDARFRLFLSYSLNKNITISPDFYFDKLNFKNNQDEIKGYGGINIGVRIF